MVDKYSKVPLHMPQIHLNMPQTDYSEVLEVADLESGVRIPKFEMVVIMWRTSTQ